MTSTKYLGYVAVCATCGAHAKTNAGTPGMAMAAAVQRDGWARHKTLPAVLYCPGHKP